MKNKPVTNLAKMLLLTGLLLFLVSCDASQTANGTSKYDALCQIYEDVLKNKSELRDKEMKIAENVQKELPKFFEANFVHIIKADPEKRYQFIKQIVEEETEKAWECKVIQSYYANEFNSK